MMGDFGLGAACGVLCCADGYGCSCGDCPECDGGIT